MKEFIGNEEVFGKRILSNGDIEWFGTVTGRHICQQKGRDIKMNKNKSL